MWALILHCAFFIWGTKSNPVLTPISFGSRFDDFFIEPLIRHPDGRPPQLCLLPKPFNPADAGNETLLQDCRTFHKYQEFPPRAVLGYSGINPIICCPPEDILLLPNEFEKLQQIINQSNSTEMVDFESDYAYEVVTPPANFDVAEYYDYDIETCPYHCVTYSFCDLKGQAKPPLLCGWEEGTKDDLFCCEEKTSIKNEPMDKKYGDHECLDFHPHCKTILELDPKSCDDDFISNQFMRVACMETCGRCKEKGCRDEFEECQKWSMNGDCSRNAPFMIFNCRESCGTCGMRSDRLPLTQVDDNGNDFSNIESSSFFCGMSLDFDNELRTGLPFTESKLTPILAVLRQDFIDPAQANEKQLISCGSVLINDRFILTAAHCEEQFMTTTSTRSVVIRHGTLYAETIDVKRTFMHPYYKYPLNYNDIALSELGRRVIFDFVKYGDSPMCLGRQNSTELINRTALVQGFGITEDGKQSDGLLQANVTVISNENCAQYVSYNVSDNKIDRKRIIDAAPFGIVSQVICTMGIEDPKSGNFSGPCEGDSGGPLFLQEKTGFGPRSTLIGIVAGGLGCGKSIPTWYTNIPEYMPWIDCIVNAGKAGYTTRTINAYCEKAAKRILGSENEIN